MIPAGGIPEAAPRLHEVFNNCLITVASMDRLLLHCHNVGINGDSDRQKVAEIMVYDETLTHNLHDRHGGKDRRHQPVSQGDTGLHLRNKATNQGKDERRKLD